jgi:hypothetical protein
MPWGQVEGPAQSFSAFQLRLYGPILLSAATGVALIVAAALRSRWVSTIGMASLAIVALILVISHDYIFSGVTMLAPTSFAIGLGGRPCGYGPPILSAAALLAAAAGIVVHVQLSPEVPTAWRPEADAADAAGSDVVP